MTHAGRRLVLSRHALEVRSASLYGAVQLTL
eukprot:CAMPEP_0117582660 /NCGR_PEP_ID=MMETSP0784-20121206/66562_1 /TAXON_ID=39447 /ORGANISM="" /LENGTH=30 /DNA_ID= /DNA_START= /DNA_END= /DNA_ORIENTATION=